MTREVSEKKSGQSVSTKMAIDGARKVAEQTTMDTEHCRDRGMALQAGEMTTLTLTSIAQKIPVDYKEEITQHHGFTKNVFRTEPNKEHGQHSTNIWCTIQEVCDSHMI